VWGDQGPYKNCWVTDDGDGGGGDDDDDEFYKFGECHMMSIFNAKTILLSFFPTSSTS
jgi:hypothetical protein